MENGIHHQLPIMSRGPPRYGSYQFLTRLDRNGEIEIWQRPSFNRWGHDRYQHYWDQNDQLWILANSSYRFTAYQINNDGDQLINEPVSDLLGGYFQGFGVHFMTDSLGYPYLVGHYRYDHNSDLRWYRLSMDFSEVLNEGIFASYDYEIPDGDVAIGPGDTLHIVYTYSFSDSNGSHQPLYYMKATTDGEICYGPVTHTSIEEGWQDYMDNMRGDIQVDDFGNAYILFDHSLGMYYRFLCLRTYTPDGSVVDRHLSTSHDDHWGRTSSISLDCMGNMNVFWPCAYSSEGTIYHTVYNDTAQIVEPYIILEDNYYTISQINSFASEDEYRIGVAYHGRLNNEEHIRTRVMLLQRPNNAPTHYLEVQEPNSSDVPFSPSLSVYPNPCNGQLTIQYSSPAVSPVQYMLYDCLGRTVLSESLPLQSNSTVRIIRDLNGLASGTYFLRIGADQNWLQERILYLR